MAIQATSTTVDLEADNAADLTALNDVRLADGYRVWVKAAGASHGLWCLDKNSVLVANGVTVIATFSGVGRWILFGSGGGGATNGFEWFETLADAAAAPGPAVKTGAWIAETDAPYEFFPGDVTPPDVGLWTVIGNTGGTNGR